MAATEWLTPGVLLSAIGLVAGGIAWLVAWSIRQDRRIESKASRDWTDEQFASMKFGIANDDVKRRGELDALNRMFTSMSAEAGQLASLAQTRDSCAQHRAGQSQEINDNRRKIDVLSEQIRGLMSNAEDQKKLLRSVEDLVRVTNDLRIEIATLRKTK